MFVLEKFARNFHKQLNNIIKSKPPARLNKDTVMLKYYEILLDIVTQHFYCTKLQQLKCKHVWNNINDTLNIAKQYIIKTKERNYLSNLQFYISLT